jgi:hypothetical protein
MLQHQGSSLSGYYDLNYNERQDWNPKTLVFSRIRDSFKSRKMVYDSKNTIFVNNYYLEKNIKKFLKDDVYQKYMSKVKKNT